MNNFNWKKAIGLGVGLWLVLFIVAMILVVFGVTLSVGWMFLLAILAAIIAYSLSVNVDPRSTGTAFGYGLTWAAVGIILDSLISSQFAAGQGIFGLWSYWVGYALVLLAPWMYMAVRRSPKPSLR
jgi:hypothetical protein